MKNFLCFMLILNLTIFSQLLSTSKILYFINETPFDFTVTIAGIRAPAESVSLTQLVAPLDIPEDKFFLKAGKSGSTSFEIEEDDFNLLDSDKHYDLSKARLILNAHTGKVSANPELASGHTIKLMDPIVTMPTLIIQEIKDGNYIVKYDEAKKQLYLEWRVFWQIFNYKVI